MTREVQIISFCAPGREFDLQADRYERCRRTFAACTQGSAKSACRGSKSEDDFLNPADRPRSAYLRAAQAYMLISIPTETSTIFGAFQVIQSSMDFWRAVAPHQGRTSSDVTQVVTAKLRRFPAKRALLVREANE
jgi:hypothetical protein